jgi:ribosome-associated protein
VLEVSANIRIPLEEFQWSFVRAGGPGGQNVNKVASKAVLRWPMETSEHVPLEVKTRVRQLYPSRVTTEGEIVISSQEFRDQDRNRQACLEKLTAILQHASIKPKARKATKPSKGSKLRRLEEKKQQSARKASRRVSKDD